MKYKSVSPWGGQLVKSKSLNIRKGLSLQPLIPCPFNVINFSTLLNFMCPAEAVCHCHQPTYQVVLKGR